MIELKEIKISDGACELSGSHIKSGYEIALESINSKEVSILLNFKQMNELHKHLNKGQEFEKAYNILMDYFDCIPEEERAEVDKRLKKVGC